MADKSILDLINEVAADNNHIHDISVLPLMCGTGKSTAISYKIRQTIEEAPKTGNGLLIITDRKDRMDDYMHPYDDELREYLLKHENKITIMHHDNLNQAYKTFRFRPVLMMTTQRFFRLAPHERTEFLKWENGPRPLVLIDERPELTTIAEIDETKIEECIIAVEHVLKNRHDIPPTIEMEIIEREFKQFISDLKFSPCNRLNYLFCFWSWYINEESCAPFTDIQLLETYRDIYYNRENINGYKGDIYYKDIFTQIRALRQLRRENALLYHQKLKTNVCLDTFYVFLNNISALADRNTKYIILDGTALLSPEYRIEQYDIRPCEEYVRDLSRLKIRIVNIPTNKTSMLYNKEYHERAQAYVECYFNENIKKEIGNDKNKYALFTYKGVEEKYKKMFDADRVEHFGNIVGKNDFRKATHILQVGINRYPDTVYYLYYLALHPEMHNYYTNMQEAYKMGKIIANAPTQDILDEMGITFEQWSQEYEAVEMQVKDGIDSDTIIKQSNEIEQQINEHRGEVNDIMNHMLLAEIEQNMFRGIIRNSNPDNDYTFHLFINTTNYESLVELIKSRYEPLGADVKADMVSTEVAIRKIMNRKKTSHAAEFIIWHDTKLDIGDSYTPERIREGIGLKNKAAIQSYEQMFKNNPVLRILLANEKDESEKERGVYKKLKNWYFYR